MPNFDVNRPEDLKKVLGKRRDEANKRKMNSSNLDKEEHTPTVEHLDAANQLVKIINVIKMEPIIKKVMSMRIIRPLETGEDRSYLSIGLELGISEREIKQIEEAGVEILAGYMTKYCSSEFVEKFNREKKLREELNKIKLG